MFRNILVSVDGSSHSDEALAQSIDLATAMNARLTVFTAVRETSAWAAAPAAGAAIVELADDLEREAEQILASARERVPAEISVTTVLAHEPVRISLIRQLEAGHHDLLVMGSRGRSAVRSTLLGSVSAFAMHHSPIPVLVVHAAGDREGGPSPVSATAPA
jgi:nucleotide-binding universal stress UspA family protein